MDRKEYRNDKELTGVLNRLEFNPIRYDLKDQIVNDRAEGNGEQREAEVLADLSEYDLTDDNGCETDHDGATACIDICKALILGI